MSEGPDHEHTRGLPETAQLGDFHRVIRDVAEAWGGEWRGGAGHSGQLELPIVSGLRVGWITAAVAVDVGPGGRSLRLRVERSRERAQWGAVLLLMVAALGGLSALFLPLLATRNPQLLALAPVGALLSLGGWFLIVARLRTAGPREFLDQVAGELEPATGLDT